MHKELFDAFKKLWETAEILMGPNGCPWDREQTLVSIRGSVLEEACEVIEAIDGGDDENLQEELGDLLYNVIFLSLLARKENRFLPHEPIDGMRKKLIERHPHVFGERVDLDSKQVKEQWEQIKKREKKHRESLLDGIPKALPALDKAHRIADKMQKDNYVEEAGNQKEFSCKTEEEVGAILWEISKRASVLGINPECALRKILIEKERKFRHWEKNRDQSDQK